MCTASDSKTINNRLPVSGFTLVELLVVIATVSLLMGILAPVVGKVKAAAYRVHCGANLRQMGIAFAAYLDDNSNIMPPAVDYPLSNPDPNAITAFLLPLLRQPQVFKCKADTRYNYYQQWGTSYHYHGQGPFGLGGKAISDSHLAKEGVSLRNINVMNDFDPFHGKAGRPGAENYLYADWHVGDLSDQ
jgi:type II secretory pathway pseudopilin PulG